jgi:predicted amidophosphoribosyltransferase
MNSFRLKQTNQLQNNPILLVDDVITTSAIL